MAGRHILILCALVAGCQSQSVNCGATTNAGNVVSTVGCREAPQPPSDDDGGFISSNTMYLVVIVFGLVAIPATAIVRICWTRRLYGRGRRLPNRDGNHPSRQCPNGRGDLFTIDIDTSQFPVIPTYQEAIVSPVTDSPPPYDKLPPCYADVVKATKEKEPQPSTSSECTENNTCDIERG